MTQNLGCNHAVGKSIQVTAGDSELFTYVYRATDPQLESPRPYLHPIRTLDGDLVSVFRPHDHVWHKGMTWSLPHFGHENFWGGPTFSKEAGYQQLDNNGSMDHDRIDALDVSDDLVRFSHHLSWRTQAGAHVVDESRTLTTRFADDGWVLVYETAMTNVSSATIQIGSPTTAGRENAGYGGLFWRGPRSFTDGTVLAQQGTGGDELRGQRAAWMGFSGKHDSNDRASTIIIADAADNVGTHRSGSSARKTSPPSARPRSSPRNSPSKPAPPSASATPSWSPTEAPTTNAPPPGRPGPEGPGAG